jgi:hypothetical protein
LELGICYLELGFYGQALKLFLRPAVQHQIPNLACYRKPAFPLMEYVNNELVFCIKWLIPNSQSPIPKKGGSLFHSGG